MRQRLYVAGILAGLGTLIVLVVLIFRFGRYDPSPPSLQKHPNPAIPGEIIFIDTNGCIIRADASGVTREQVYCVGRDVSFVSWLDRQTVVFAESASYRPAAQPTYSLKAIDLVTKKTRETDFTVSLEKVQFGSPISVKGERAEVDEEGRLFVISEGVRTQVADFDTRRYGGPEPIAWSPDGGWLLLQHFPVHGEGNELWIVSRDGQVQGTLAGGVRGPWVSWWIDGVGYSPAVEGLPAAK